MPNKIPTTVLTEGVKDLQLVKEWGDYLAVKKTIQKVNPRNNRTYEETVGAVTTSQIRKFFGAIKRIQADFDGMSGEILLLSPKLAYAVGRDGGKTKLKEFYETLSPLIENIKEDRKRFQNFVNVFEAIVAYHKAAGGE